MNTKHASLILALILTAAGCQHDPSLARASIHRMPLEVAYHPDRAEADAYRIQAMPDPPRIVTADDSSRSLLFFLSIPIYPDNNVQFARSRFVLGGPAFNMQWAGPFEPLPKPASGSTVRLIGPANFENDLVHTPAVRSGRAISGSTEMVAVPHDAYAESVRTSIYRIDVAQPVVPAPAPVRATTAAAEED